MRTHRQPASLPKDSRGPARSSDYVLGNGKDLKVPFHFKVVSPKFAPPYGNQVGFDGDYSGLIINKEDEAILSGRIRQLQPIPLEWRGQRRGRFTDRVALWEEERQS